MHHKKSLSDILRTPGDRGKIERAWNEATPATDYSPLPAGDYLCRALSGELQTSRHGTPGYNVTFKILEGEFTGRQLWLTCWLTEAAMPATLRDLRKLGIQALADLERPLNPGQRCRVRVALRTSDDGTERNEVRGFAVVGIDMPERDPFAPPDSGFEDPFPPTPKTEGGA